MEWKVLRVSGSEPPNVVVLDLKLPGLSGKELCRSFKTEMPSVPIVVLSANADVDDKVVLLELGADDYVTKPFSPKELLARVRRAMRRNVRKQQGTAGAEAASPHDLLVFGDVEIDFTSMEAKRAGKPVSMTAQEFKLLRFLSRSTDRVISREELLNEVWGYQNYPSTRTVDNHILRLRQKLEPDPAHPRFFVTVHSAGYKFVPGNAAVNKKELTRFAESSMARLRLQSQLLLSTLLIICALTGAILLILRHTVRTQIADQVKYSTRSILPGIRDGSAGIAAPVVPDGVAAGRNSHVESADDHAGRADHPGWVHSLLEARGERSIPARGPGRPRGRAGRHPERAQPGSGGRISENFPGSKGRTPPGGTRTAGSIGSFSARSSRGLETMPKSSGLWPSDMRPIRGLPSSLASSRKVKSCCWPTIGSLHPLFRRKKRP